MLTDLAFLAWLKLSVYMAIVAVAIVLNFHLKSKPSALGKPCESFQHPQHADRSREKVVAPARHRVLAAIFGMLVIWRGQLHWYSVRLQSPSGTGADRLEDTDGVYGGCSGDCGHLRFVVIYKRAESVDGPSLS